MYQAALSWPCRRSNTVLDRGADFMPVISQLGGMIQMFHGAMLPLEIVHEFQLFGFVLAGSRGLNGRPSRLCIYSLAMPRRQCWPGQSTLELLRQRLREHLPVRDSAARKVTFAKVQQSELAAKFSSGLVDLLVVDRLEAIDAPVSDLFAGSRNCRCRHLIDAPVYEAPAAEPEKFRHCISIGLQDLLEPESFPSRDSHWPDHSHGAAVVMAKVALHRPAVA